MFWASLSLWALYSHTTKQHYSVGQICLQIETKDFCTVQKNESHIPTVTVVVVNCQTLKTTFNRNWPATGRINPNTLLTYHVGVDIYSNTEKLNCRYSFDTWNTEIDNLCGGGGEDPAIIDYI